MTTSVIRMKCECIAIKLCKNTKWGRQLSVMKKAVWNFTTVLSSPIQNNTEKKSDI